MELNPTPGRVQKVLSLKGRTTMYFIKAINYALCHWEGLTLFIEDVSIPLTTNDAERTLRSCVLERKNFYGSKSINRADTTQIYTR